MKKTAWILLFVLIFSLCPIFPTDSVSASDRQSISDILGMDDVNWYELNHYTFATDTYTGVDENMVANTPGFTEENGLVLEKGKGSYLRIIKRDYWSPISDGTITTFRAKVMNETDVFMPLWQKPTTTQEKHRAALAITASGIAQGEGAVLYLDKSFAPGLGWVDYLLKSDTDSQWSFYAKPEGETGWQFVAQGLYGTNGGPSTGLYFSGAGYVKEAKRFCAEQFASQYQFQMDSGFDPNPETIITTGTVTYTDENGLAIPSASEWKFLPQSGWSALSDGKNVTFRAKAPASGGLNIQLSAPDTSLKRRVYIDLSALALTVVGNASHTGFDANTPEFSFVPGTDWHDYLIKANGNDSYSVYILMDGIWTLYTKTLGYTDAGAAEVIGVKLFSSGNDACIQNVRIFDTASTSDALAKPSAEIQAYYTENFTSAPKYKNYTTTGNASFQNEMLVLNNSGTFGVSQCAIPNNGYAEFKMKSNSAKTKVAFYDGTKSLSLVTYGASTMVNGTAISTMDSGNIFRIWRIVRNANGTFDGYLKSENEDSWYLAFQNITGTDDTTEKGFSFTQDGHPVSDYYGFSQFDYIRIYGPSVGKPMVITDGASTVSVPENGKVRNPDSICAVVEADPEADRLLIMMEYNDAGDMVKDTVYQIPKGTAPSSIVHSVHSKESDPWQLKAYLWDSEHKPLQNPHAVRSGTISWNEEGWGYGGDHQIDNGVTKISSTGNKTSYAETGLDIGSTFDVSWTMNLDQSNGSNSVVLSNGIASATFEFTSTNVAFSTSSETKTIPYTIGTNKLTYRVVGNKSNWDLYIDDNLVADMNALFSTSDSSGIRFETAGSNSGMSIYEVSVGFYDSYFDPTKTQSFDNGDMTGWTQTKVYPVSADVGYECWSSENGLLMLQNPTYLSPPLNKNIEIGDDFILETRVRFQNLGNWFYILMGAKDHYMHLEVHHDFLTFVTPVDDPTTENFQDAHSDPVEIDPQKWYTLKIESYNNSNNARVYLDDKLVMEEELADYPNYPNQLIQFGGYGCHLDDCIVDIDWVRYMTVPARMENVIPAPSGNASATLNAVQSGNSVSASLANLTSFDSVASVSYYLDGNAVTTVSDAPYSVSIPNVTEENHRLEAIAYDHTGIVVARTSTELLSTNGANSLNYSNEIRYTASGDGTVEFSNGNHKVSLSHAGSALTYQTDTGAETYSHGAGEFCIITDGPIAEVYRNGQFVFSYYLPRTTDQSGSYTGAVSDYSVTATPERKNYFVSRDVTPQNQLYQLADFPYSYNMDFVAGADDQLTLSVNDGYYLSKVSIENGKLYVWDGPDKMALSEKTFVENVTTDAYYRVETSGGMSRLYKNGRWISTFRSEHSVGSPYLAVNLTQGTLPYLAVNDCTDVYIYEDTFDESGEVSALDFWREENLTQSIQNGNLVLDASGKTNAITELYAFSGDFDLSAKVNVSSIGTLKSGGFWFLLNHSITDTYTKVGWNHQTFLSNKYEIVDRIDGKDQSDSATKSGSLPTGQTVQLDLKVRRTEAGETITLYVNGSQVVSQTGHFERYGKIGFILSNCTATIEEISYRGNARPVARANDAIFPISITSGGMRDLLELDNGDVYIINHIEGLKTNDGGETFENVASKLVFQKDDQGNDTQYVDTVNTIGITSTRNYGWNNSMVRLQNGTYLSITPRTPQRTEYNKSVQDYTIAKSTDGLHWSDIITNNPPYYEKRIGTSPTVNCLKQGASGRIYYTYHYGANEDIGDVQIWYSDDNGRNWTHSITIHGKDTGHVLAESQVVESETSTKLFFRNDKGYLCYYTSPDRGKTWDLEHLYKTPMIASEACFNIEVDPKDPNTFYVAWEYNNLNLFGRHQWPRTRWSVAKSTDGGTTWEFVGTVDENNHESYTSSNMSMNVSNDYVIVNADALDDEDGTNKWRGRMVMFPQNTAKTSKRFEQLHYQYETQIDNTKVMPKERLMQTLAIHPESGRVLLHGERVENAAPGEYLSRKVAEAFLGKTLSVPQEALTTINGTEYVKISALAEAYGLTLVEESGTLILSPIGDWSVRQMIALRTSVDLFSE